MSKFHRDTSVLQKQVIALKLEEGFVQDQNAGSFSLSIGHGTGFSLEQISRENCGGVRHLRTVHPQSADAMHDGGTRIYCQQRQRELG
jgi:hypothetical protein